MKLRSQTSPESFSARRLCRVWSHNQIKAEHLLLIAALCPAPPTQSDPAAASGHLSDLSNMHASTHTRTSAHTHTAHVQTHICTLESFALNASRHTGTSHIRPYTL